MTLNNHYQKIKYLDATRDLLRELYSIEDCHSGAYERTRDKLDGFMQAGIVIGVASKQELQDVIDKEHMDKFGITIKQRRAELKLENKESEIDWDIYDTPTIHRR